MTTNPITSASIADFIHKKAAAHKALAGLNVDDLASANESTRRTALRAVRKLTEQHVSTSAQSVATGLMVGLVLVYIKKTKAHRLGKKKQSFAIYVKEHYDISENYANRLSSVAINWPPIADEPVQPSSLDSLRPLKRLSTDEQKQEAWRIAVELAGTASPDAKQVKAAVRMVLGEEEPAPKPSKVQLLAAEVLALLNQQLVEKACSRLSQELPAGSQGDATAIAEAPAIPVLTHRVEPENVHNDCLYTGADCTVTRQGDILVIVAHPKYRESLVSHGLMPGAIDGEWILKLKGKGTFNIPDFIEKLRESLKQGLLLEVSNV